jgi:hypothetical protein
MIDMTGHDLPQHVQALEAAKRGEYGRARTLLSQLPDGPPWTLVRADPEIFRYRKNPEDLKIEQEYNLSWGIDPAFLVITPDEERAKPAIERTVGRIQCVTGSGREQADWENNAGYSTDYDEDTPNSSRIYQSDEGPIVRADTKTQLSPERGYSMLRILVDEIIAENVRALIIYPPAGIARGNRWSPPPVSAQPREPRPQALFIARFVTVDIGDGRRYLGEEYLGTDGKWTMDKLAARQWPLTTAIGDLASLAETLRDHDDPAVNGQPACRTLDA